MLCHCSMVNSHMSLRSTSAHCLVGLGRVELPTSRLSGVRSNHLSYRPDGVLFGKKQKNYLRQKAYRRKDLESRKSQRDSNITLRKEVIQPQVLLRLPCYDFTPITSHTLDGYLLAVESPASSTTGFREDRKSTRLNSSHSSP